MAMAGCANPGGRTSITEAKQAAASIPVASLTTAPRRVSTRARLATPVEQVWAYLGNHQNLLEYSDGVLGEVIVDDSDAVSPQGVGTRRQCITGDGKDKFVEQVVYYKAPFAFAYSATENTWGLKDHLATVMLEPDGRGGTLLQWDQYFNHAMPDAAPKVAMNIDGMLKGKILKFLATKFGGEVL